MKTKHIASHFILVVNCIILLGCNNNVKNESESKTSGVKKDSTSSKVTTISFNEETYDFGDIREGEKMMCSFPFTNTGDVDLLITNAVGSCGCTIPTFPKTPIKKGEKGKIDVVFDSEGLSGIMEKSIMIYCNCGSGVKKIFIKSNIIPLKKRN